MRRLSAAEGRETRPVCIRLGKCAQGPDRQHQTISELTHTHCLSFFFAQGKGRTVTLTIMSPRAVFISPFWLMHANLMNVSYLGKKAFLSG